MVKMTFDELNAALDNCIEAGVIYNVDFKDWTSYGANRMLEADIRAIREEFIYNGKFQDRTEEELNLIDSLNDSIVQFPTKKTMNILGDMLNVGVAKAVINLVLKWKPVAEKFRNLKPMVVKGRKPADKPRKTEERTLKNTGTCPICGKNVKMDATGKLVAHGFTIRYGFQEGNCFGVGYEPVEVSPVGMVDYAKVLEEAIDRFSTQKTKMMEERPVLYRTEGYGRNKKIIEIKDGDSGYQHVLNNQVHNLETTIRHMGLDLNMFKERIDAWKPLPLPG